ncbi:hypothetical protein B0J11DRAFT_112517 [Dendryphion nanum]|uniref:Uncharacterized protein n=1 Tax=Dendryphion nanum TaxID=256645 RepID=A0A9P9IDG5_9PLEO|nr:hypothetical protein B0J11DRAFT_112517 [Dendryphion nanum]
MLFKSSFQVFSSVLITLIYLSSSMPVATYTLNISSSNASLQNPGPTPTFASNALLHIICNKSYPDGLIILSQPSTSLLNLSNPGPKLEQNKNIQMITTNAYQDSFLWKISLPQWSTPALPFFLKVQNTENENESITSGPFYITPPPLPPFFSSSAPSHHPNTPHPRSTAINTSQLRADLTSGVILGIVLGFVGLVGVSGTIFYWLCSKRRRATVMNAQGSAHSLRDIGVAGAGLRGRTVVTVTAGRKKKDGAKGEESVGVIKDSRKEGESTKEGEKSYEVGRKKQPDSV